LVNVTERRREEETKGRGRVSPTDSLFEAFFNVFGAFSGKPHY
jgi:hypothetical protein